METYSAGDFDNPSNVDDENDNKETGDEEKEIDTAAAFAKRPDGKVTCLVKKCNKTFSSMSHAKEHYVRKHQPPQKLKCKLCSDVLPHIYALNRHVNRNHGISSNEMKNVVTVPAPKL